MKRSLRKNLMTILMFIFLTMMLFSALTVAVAVKADITPVDIKSATITMQDGASIKQSGKMGIRFRATISTEVYGGLNAKYGSNVSYGMIIAPADYVDSNDEMNVNGWSVTVDQEEINVVKYDGTLVSGVKYFQMATVTPAYNDQDKIYEIYGAFVGIYEENYARDFTVRAFICAENEYVYSAQTSRNVYTVATYAMEAGAIEDETAETYFNSIIGSVNKVYSSGYMVSVENLTDNAGKIEVGDKLRFTATLTDEKGNEIEAKPTLSSINGKLVQNIDQTTGLGDGTYTVMQAGDFYVNANVEGTVEGKSTNKSKAIWLDGVNTTGTVTEYDLDATPDFFTFGSNTTLIKGEEPADTNSDLYKAIATNPTEKDVLVFHSPNGGDNISNVLLLGRNYKEDIVGKYLSFKYYSTLTGTNSTGWAFSETPQMYVSSYDRSAGSTNYGRWILNQYDNNYNLIESKLTASNCYGTWVTVEIKVMEYSTTGWIVAQGGDGQGVFGRIHINGENANKYLYFTDFKVSDYSLTEAYSNYEIKVSGATGENGVVNPGDVLDISLFANIIGKPEKVKVPVKINFTSDSLIENNGVYIYQGKGDFVLTATCCGVNTTLNVSGKVGVIPFKKQLDISTFVTTYKTNDSYVSTLEKVTDNIPGNAPTNKDVYKYTGSNGQSSGTGFYFGANYAKSEIEGFYLTFKYYYTEIIWLCGKNLSNGDIDRTGSSFLPNYGNWAIKQYDESGNHIDATNSMTSHKNQWVTVEMFITSVPTYKDKYLEFHIGAVGEKTCYLTDFTLSNYSIMGEN